MTTTPINLGNTQKSLIEPMTLEQRERAIHLLEEWCNVSEEEAAEQRETGQYLKEALDSERRRIGARTLFS